MVWRWRNRYTFPAVNVTQRRRNRTETSRRKRPGVVLSLIPARRVPELLHVTGWVRGRGRYRRERLTTALIHTHTQNSRELRRIRRVYLDPSLRTPILGTTLGLCAPFSCSWYGHRTRDDGVDDKRGDHETGPTVVVASE